MTRSFSHLPKHAVLVVASLIALFPVYVMVTAAFKTQGGFLNDPFSPLAHPTLNGFRTALNDQFPRWLLNSVMVTGAAVAATLARVTRRS